MTGTVEIKNGIYDLLIGGSFITNSVEPTALTLKGEGDEQPITLIFKFENEDKDPNLPRKIGTVVNDTTLEIVFTNYTNTLGSYNKEFWSIGTLGNRQLYFTYIIYVLADTKLKKMDYTFYLGEEVNNG